MGQLRDGLGGEEAQFSGLTTLYNNGYMSPYWVGSVNAAGGLFDGNGQVSSVSLGSPGTFGAFMQTGSAGTSAGSSGFIALLTPYTSDYNIFLTPFSGTSTAGFTSGVQNLTSGVNFVGGASGRYKWLAIGI